MYDAQAYLSSIDRPQFIDQTGKKHIGKILGSDDWLRLQSKIRLSKNPDGSWNAPMLNRAMMEIVRTVFPSKWYKPWERSVRHWIWKLPPLARMEAVWDFMESLAKVIGMEWEPLGTVKARIAAEIEATATATAGSPTSGR